MLFEIFEDEMKVSERESSLHQMRERYLWLQAHLKDVSILSEEVIPSITLFIYFSFTFAYLIGLTMD